MVEKFAKLCNFLDNHIIRQVIRSDVISIIVDSLKRSGHLDSIHITICNVGSRKLDQQDDYGSQGWEIFAPHLSIYGFDADAEACDEANAQLETRNINWTEKHIPLALSNSVGETTLYVTKHPMCM
jgi:hypothetical protein